MKAIAKYRADDGSEFNSEQECIDYETLCEDVSALLNKLNPVPKDVGCRFSNGHGYIQQTAGTFLFVREQLLRMAQRFSGRDPDWLQQAIDNPSVHASWAGRLISDGCPRPINKGWYRVMCTDAKYREWGQPYYANNPQDAPYQQEVSSPL